MDFNFTEQQNEFRDKVRGYVDTNITPSVVREIEEKDEFPHDLVKKFCDLGLAKVNIPEEYGGMGGGIFELMIINEEIAKKLPVLGWNTGNILLYGNEIIGVNGNKEQKDEFFPKLGRAKSCSVSPLRNRMPGPMPPVLKHGRFSRTGIT